MQAQAPQNLCNMLNQLANYHIVSAWNDPACIGGRWLIPCTHLRLMFLASVSGGSDASNVVFKRCCAAAAASSSAKWRGCAGWYAASLGGLAVRLSAWVLAGLDPAHGVSLLLMAGLLGPDDDDDTGASGLLGERLMPTALPGVAAACPGDACSLPAGAARPLRSVKSS